MDTRVYSVWKTARVSTTALPTGICANTFGLSLREGFQDWAKFGITAFATFDKRKFQLPAQIPGLSYDPEYGSGLNASPSAIEFPITQVYDEFSTYIGAEISNAGETF
ncbi:MAG: putative porin [Parabacteroides merdae]